MENVICCLQMVSRVSSGWITGLFLVELSALHRIEKCVQEAKQKCREAEIVISYNNFMGSCDRVNREILPANIF